MAKQIIWNPMNGLALPDGRIEPAMPDLLAHLEKEGSITIGSHLLFNAFRAHIKRGALKDFVVVVHGTEYPIYPNGCLPNWPFDLDRQFDEYLTELL